jgi:polar amino acid transport system substrate-binding protein
LKGYSVELALRFAEHEVMNIEFAEMEFGAMIPYVVSGKADFAIADISVTEERKKSVLFTDSIYDDQGGIIALKPIAADSESVITENAGFIAWLKSGIERNLITDARWKMIVNGLGVTMSIAFFAQLFGTAFGCFVCWLLTRKNKFIKLIGNLYCGLIHGTPIVVLLMITYYIIFGSTDISNVIVAIAAFTIITGANVAGVLQSAIETVDTVEIEAARSIGFSAFKAVMLVTFPQAIRRALPAYTKGFVELVKATAIVGYIAIQDLTRAGDIIRSRTYDAYFPLLFVALIYLIVTSMCVQVFKMIVSKINGGKA